MGSEDNADIRQFIYRVDHEDTITFVNEDWANFGRENQLGEDILARIVGSSLWDYISDLETASIYEQILAEVRLSQAPSSVRFRCDSPSRLRLMMMELCPIGQNEIELVCHVLEQNDRKPIALFDPNAARSDEYVTVCSWCKKIGVGDEWIELTDAAQKLGLFAGSLQPQITHGMCSPCRKNLSVKARSSKS